MRKSLNKSERLKKRDDIQLLFKKGLHEFVYPFKLYYLEKENIEDSALLFGVSIPKKNFKKAVYRNLLKRRTREAYRLHQIPLKEALISRGKCLMIMPVYIADEILDYKEIEDKIILLLQRLLRIYEQGNQ